MAAKVRGNRVKSYFCPFTFSYMQLIQVTDSSLAAAFIQVNVVLNKEVPGYIRPRNVDINEVFDPSKNKAFRHGECVRWVLKDADDRLIGRMEENKAASQAAQ